MAEKSFEQLEADKAAIERAQNKMRAEPLKAMLDAFDAPEVAKARDLALIAAARLEPDDRAQAQHIVSVLTGSLDYLRTRHDQMVRASEASG
jgi:hypothetical protein